MSICEIAWVTLDRVGNIAMDSILTKVVAESTAREIVALVKAVILTRPEIFEIISALAQRERYPGESPKRAVTRFVLRDPNGSELYQLMHTIPRSKATVQLERLLQTKSGEELGNLNTRTNAKILNGRRLAHNS